MALQVPTREAVFWQAIVFTRQTHEREEALSVSCHPLPQSNDGLDTDMAFLPFKPIAMKVLRCLFLCGIRTSKIQPLLNILRPKIVAFREDLKQHITVSKSSSHSFSIMYYNENETREIQKLKDNMELEIAIDLATEFCWKKLKQGNIDITRLEGQLFIKDGKHQLLSGNKEFDSSRRKPLLHWRLLDMEKLLAMLSKLSINGSIK